MSDVIELRNVSKVFDAADGDVCALNNINLKIPEGAVFGIIGMSGAGKSTLVRCINLLERPAKGEVLINGVNITDLDEKALNRERKNIGMIFQHFNLLMQKTVLDNVMFPMINSGVPKKEAKAKAQELLEVVGLADKEKSYPVRLSGGQKQRVAIARALAQNPKILLCDEATSALDPQTTQSILDLLKSVNEKYKITIVVITHEMAVVRQICDKVAILSEGRLAEEGNVIDLFTHPKTPEGRKLIFNENMDTVSENTSDEDSISSLRKIRLVYLGDNSAKEPVIANMILKYNAPVSILFAQTKEVEGKARGHMILSLPDDEETADKMIRYLKDNGIEVEEVD